MNCTKCAKSLPRDAKFCCFCGYPVSISTPPKKAKVRGNGQGCAYKVGSTWTAQVILGYRPPKDDSRQPIPIKRKKGGFKTKAAALAYCPILKGKKPECALSLQQLYEEWSPWYQIRIDPETFGCYRAAFNYYSSIGFMKIVDITAGDLQKCMDACPRGHRTHQNMKVVAGLLWKYATDRNYVPRNVAENLYIGKGHSVQREPLTEKEVELFRQAIGKERYAEYIYCLCYLGFRPGEFCSLKKEHYREVDGFGVLINGSKTEAGRDRVVIVPPQVIDIVKDRLLIPGTDLLFPQYIFTRDGSKLKGMKQMSDEYLNKHVFRPLSARLGVQPGKVPYSARHTFSDKLKAANGDDKTKASLMGHTDYAFTQSHYQSINIDDLLDVATSIK